MIYQTTESQIPIPVILLRNNGNPDTGKSPKITLFNSTTGVLVLSAVEVPEIGSGLYRYMWNHGIIVNSTINYFILNGTTVVSNGSFRLVTDKQDLTDTIDFSDGRAI